MSTLPPESPGPLVDDAEETFCYGHPDTPTKLRCSRCDRPICGRCAIPASVGQHCPECVAEGRKSQRKVRSTEVKTAPATVTIIAPRLGAASLTILVVAGQLAMSLVLDHFGLVGFARRPLDPGRAAGVALVLAGALLTLRR